MKRKWEQCQTTRTGTRWGTFYVTMDTRGRISLSKFTYERLGEPQQAQLLYDRATNTIGINPVGTRTPDSFYLGKKYTGGRLIHGLRLIQEFGIKIPRSLRFMSPEIDEDGVLILDLNDTRPATKGRAPSPKEPNV